MAGPPSFRIARDARDRAGPSRRIESAVESGAGAVWQRARFGTVRPRVQIPGPRPALTSNGRFLGSSGCWIAGGFFRPARASLLTLSP